MRNKIQAALVIFGSISLIAVGPRCSSGSSDCTQTSTCPSDAASEPAPVVCDLTKDPKDQAGCLDDRVGLFVSPTGSDMAAGTKEAPMQTIGHALTSVGPLTRVYVCEGTYSEDISIAAPVDGVSIYGGFKCADWSYSGTKAQVGKSQVAFKINATTKPISIEDLAITSADGNAASPSSIAALVTSATGAVTFSRVSFTAGKGLVGADGTAGANYTATAASDGNAASGASGGPLQTCSGLCTDMNASTGGSGGQGTTSPGDGNDGSPSLGGGVGGKKVSACGSGGTGGDGAVATVVGADAASPTSVGTLSATGWAPNAGTSGKNGAVAQGGGGGAGQSQASNGGGGGGACGGCGGGGGNGGSGGGGSIALAAVSSNVSVNSGQLVAHDGGNGGKGALGQDGQSGGAHGNGSGFGCSGGNGGKGSAGGTGAGGVGGISVGVLYTGNAPTLDTATSGAIMTGMAGTKGLGGKPGTNDGIDGVAQPTMQSP